MNDAANADDIASAREAARAALMGGVSSGSMSDARQHLLQDALTGRKNGGRAPMHLDIKKDALRSELAVKDGEKIPAKKLEKATHSDNPTLKKRAVLAETMRHWKKG